MRLVPTAIVAAFALAASPALAATSGLVRGTATLSGIPAAGVVVTLTGEGTVLRATTDAAGAFAFGRVPFGRYALDAERAGTAGFKEPVDVSSDSSVDLRFDLGLRQIGQTQTATTRGPASDPVSVTTISREQIAASPDNQSLDRLVETVPGIVRFSYNEPVAHGFHGLTYELDGIPVPQGTTSNFNEIVDPRTIDSLEVFTGAFPAEYGGSRQGAVVNILSHRINDLTTPEAGSFTAGVGSYGDAQTSLQESFKAGGSETFLSLNEERTNRGLDSPTFDPVNDRSEVSNQFLRTIVNVGTRDTLAFDASHNVAQFQIPINATSNPNDPVTSVPNQLDVQREYDSFLNLTYTSNAKNGTAYTQIAPWYREGRVTYAGDLPNDVLGTLDDGDGTTTPLDGLVQDRRSVFTGVRVNHFHAFGPNSVKLGIDASFENFSGNEQIAYTDANGNPQNFFDVTDQRGTQFGSYIQDKWTPTRYVTVSGGLRYDHSTGYVAGAQLQPRLEIDGQVDPQDILHGYYGTLYSAPFLEDTRRAAVVLAGATGAAVYDLQPEHDAYYELGLAHTFAPGDRATLNFWKRNVRDVLDTTQLAQTPVEAVFNNTIGIAQGVEGRVDARFRNGDSGFFSATLSKSQAGGISGSTFLFTPPGSDGSSDLDVTLNPEDHDQTFASTLGYTHRLGADRSFFASLQPNYGTGYPIQFQNGPGRLPPHLTFDASFGRDAKRGAHPTLGFDATFENFTNSVYLLKVNNGFNTTQFGEGFRTDLRLTAPF